MPNLVRVNVEDAVRTLYSSLDLAFSNSIADNLVLDMPQFLFVSNQVSNLINNNYNMNKKLTYDN